MILNQLTLNNFRNYSQKVQVSFSPGLNLLIGVNAVGKTNFLEAVYLLATGQSFRGAKNEELVNWEKDFALVEGIFEETLLKIGLEKKSQQVKKSFWVDGNEKKKKDFSRSFEAVIFRPEEIRVITDSPSERRDFLDNILSPLSWEYHQSVLTYNQALRKRNRLLTQIIKGRAQEQELFFWDKTLAKNGEAIRQYRSDFLDFANQFLQEFQSGKLAHFSCSYQPSVLTIEGLKDSLRKDLEYGITTIGPHRDDFVVLSSEFKTKEKDLALWGSRGQQRLATLGLKLSQMAYIEKQVEQKPILLLDDIFSELDKESQDLVVSILEGYQVVLSSTDTVDFLQPGKVFQLPLAA